MSDEEDNAVNEVVSGSEDSGDAEAASSFGDGGGDISASGSEGARRSKA
jgi:hypothetical protein